MMVVSLVLVWRLGLFILSYYTNQAFKFEPSFPYSDIYLLPSGLPQYIWSWANFDGVHYLTIAKNGYFAQFTQAFFPLYPILVGFFGGRTLAGLIISGLTLSIVSLFCALSVFHKLLSLDYPQRVANWSLLFLLFFPTGYYFGALYTESFFLFLVILSFWFARQKNWFLSGICGMFATATRITGIFLLPALLWEYLHESRITNLESRKNLIIHTFIYPFIQYSKFIIRSPILYLVPLGLISYMVYLQTKFGDALYFWHAQSAFGAERAGEQLVFPLQVIWRYMKILTSVSLVKEEFWVAFWEFTSLFAGVIGLWIAIKKHIRVSYLIFAWCLLILPLLTGTLSSFPRYILPLFPVYIVLGSLNSRSSRLALLILFTLLQIWFSIQFIRGHWVA